MAESQDEYKRRIAADIQNAQINQPSIDEENLPDENLVSLDIDNEDENTGDENQDEDESQPQISQQNIENITKKQPATPEQQIQEAQTKVPEYIEQPAAAQEPPPGGPAVQTKNIPPIDNKTDEPKRQTSSSVFGGAKQKVSDIKDQAIDRLKEQAKKLAWEAVKKAAAAAWKSIVAATSEVWVPALMIIAAIILLVIAIIFLVRAINGSEGTTPVQPVDIVSDRSLINSVLALSDPSQLQNMIASNKESLLSEISAFEQEVQTKHKDDPKTADTIKQLDAVKVLISAYDKPDATKATAIKTALAVAFKPWAVTLKVGGMIFPASNGYSKKNITQDFSSSHRGIDVGMKIGTPLYAATNGTVAYIVTESSNWPDNSDHSSDTTQNLGYGNMIIVQMETPIGQAKYWECEHISQGSVPFKEGDKIKQGDLIALSGNTGQSAGPHLHFEVTDGLNVDKTSKPIDPKTLLGW